jgi:hypothetical protein
VRDVMWLSVSESSTRTVLVSSEHSIFGQRICGYYCSCLLSYLNEFPGTGHSSSAGQMASSSSIKTLQPLTY